MEPSLPDVAHVDTATQQAIRQAEQRRIAQLLHDTVSQSLTGTYLQAMFIAQKLRKDGSEAADDLEGLVDALHGVVVELREVSRQLTRVETPPENSNTATTDGIRRSSRE